MIDGFGLPTWVNHVNLPFFEVGEELIQKSSQNGT